MQQLRLMTSNDPAAIATLAGTFADASHYDTLLTPTDGDVFVTKPDGQPLLVVLRKALTGTMYQATYAAVAPLERSSPQDNRGIASGNLGPSITAEQAKGNISTRQVGVKSDFRYRPIKRDGRVSKTNYAKRVPSFIAGYVDRSPRFPYCRQTVYTNQHPDRLLKLLPCLASLTTLFATFLPQRHATQAAQCALTHPDFVIPQTVFTTLTVNRNWSTAFHTDAGDLPEGFGVMLCLRAGSYEGGYYVMPQYRIAVDLHAGDVILSDVHEYHGNTTIEGDAKRYERITVVCYFRAKMVHCGSMQDELRSVKERKSLVRHGR